MTDQDLLRTARDVFILAEKPVQSKHRTSGDEFWSVKIAGLHAEALKEGVKDLREDLLSPSLSKQQRNALKSTALQHSVARALGARSYDHWLSDMQPFILAFLAEHGMTTPADLISWPFRPFFASKVTARDVADRLFNSGQPLPKRIYTGIDSYLFAPIFGMGDLLETVFERDMNLNLNRRLALCEKRRAEIVARAYQMREGCRLDYLDLTGRMAALNGFTGFSGAAFHLLGPNLMDPCEGAPVFRIYSSPDLTLDQRLFTLFREEIESSQVGWVDVIPLPENDRLIFLRCADGRFDWVVRDQRDEEHSSNPLYPLLAKDELPSAMDTSSLKAHLYFSTGKWREKLEHDAEVRHYQQGVTTANWPGYDRLIELELNAPRQQRGPAHEKFIPHRVMDYCLMISPLVTIRQFFELLEPDDWTEKRSKMAKRAGYEFDADLLSLNGADDPDSPAHVTWVDAIAYCRAWEVRMGLPVRLLRVVEWKQIVPRSLMENHWNDADDAAECLRWGIIDGDGVLDFEGSRHRSAPDGIMQFLPDVKRIANTEGAEFIAAKGFGEWLADVQHEKPADVQPANAPIACAATGFTVAGLGEIERELWPITDSMRRKCAKVGFRLCYVAQHDA